MALQKTEQRYSSLEGIEELDLENDSDTTLASSGFLGKTIKRTNRNRNSKIQTALTWFRWGFVVMLQIVILVLLLKKTEVNLQVGWTQAETETGGDINGLYIPCEYTFSTLRQIQ
jgi:hypothetical protein